MTREEWGDWIKAMRWMYVGGMISALLLGYCMGKLI